MSKNFNSIQETQNAYDLAARAHKLVSEHYKKQQMVENKNEDVLNLSLPEHSKAYEALRAAVLDTQTLVEVITNIFYAAKYFLRGK